jgi:nucleotide-binding universal stress UspA family protein
MYRRILVGVDGSPYSRRAVEVAMMLARTMKAEVFLISVEELPRYPAAIDEINGERQAEEIFFNGVQREATEQLSAAGLVVHTEIRVGHAGQMIPQYALEVGADLLIIGHSGHSGVWGRLLGTTADKIVDHVPCSVLVVR